MTGKENIIPEEELEVFDVNATDMRFEDEVYYTEEQGDTPLDEEIITSTVAPQTHGVEEAIDGTLEEV